MSKSEFVNFQESMGKGSAMFGYWISKIVLVLFLILGIFLIYYGSTDHVVEIPCKKDSDCDVNDTCNEDLVCEKSTQSKKHYSEVVGGVIFIVLGIMIFLFARFINRTVSSNPNAAVVLGTYSEMNMIGNMFRNI